MGNQRLAVAVPAFFIAQAVDDQLELLQSQFCVDAHSQGNHFCVNGWIRAPQRLYPELYKLPEAACLRAFITEHRACVIKLYRLIGIAMHLIFDK
ncbi:Uncharacterised protein [Mycobacteroides abscessus subsp. abscessus]|nr:Uncharacterised protein [Mycobacteroides abscessus subsp. abscessus]